MKGEGPRQEANGSRPGADMISKTSRSPAELSAFALCLMYNVSITIIIVMPTIIETPHPARRMFLHPIFVCKTRRAHTTKAALLGRSHRGVIHLPVQQM